MIPEAVREVGLGQPDSEERVKGLLPDVILPHVVKAAQELAEAFERLEGRVAALETK